MTQEEINEMVIILMTMSIDTYLRYKYMILANAMKRADESTRNFMEKLFMLVDKCRPLLLEMKGGAGA